jgi:hypothetical protein
MVKGYAKRYAHSLNPKTPLVFADGTSVYEEFEREHITHKVGYFILAPSASGKTYFIEHQEKPHWMDGDELWMAAKAHPEGAWWLESIDVIDEIDRRSDVITVEAKKLGFWIIGASNNWLIPDAVVIPDWRTHKKYLAMRDKGVYDGGLTIKQLDRLKSSRKWMARHKKSGVPIFKSVQEAVEYLSKKKSNG